MSSSRNEQLEALSSVQINGSPLLVHGSVGQAAMMGIPLPSEAKRTGALRDIDVYAPRTDRATVDTFLLESGLEGPSPVDAELSNILQSADEDDSARYERTGVSVVLQDAGILDQIEEYPISGSEGLIVRSFAPEAALAVHSLRPRIVRVKHLQEDRRLNRWFAENNVNLPRPLERSIEEFHAEYNRTHPAGRTLMQISNIYTSFVPERVRARLRPFAPPVMVEGAGRGLSGQQHPVDS